MVDLGIELSLRTPSGRERVVELTEDEAVDLIADAAKALSIFRQLSSKAGS